MSKETSTQVIHLEDPESGEIIESTPELKKESEELFAAARDQFFDLMFTVKKIFEKKAWLHLGKGYESFGDAMKSELELTSSRASQYKCIASVADSLGEKIGSRLAGEKIIKKGLNKPIKDDSTDKLRIYLQTLKELNWSKAYELSHAIESKKIDGSLLILGLSAKTPSGDEINLDKIRTATRNDLRNWFSEESSDSQKNRKTHRKVEDPDPVAEFQSHIDRTIREVERLHEKYLGISITANTYEYGKEKRRKLEDALDQFKKDVPNFEKYNVLDQETVPANLKEPEFLTIKEIATLTGKAERSVQHIAKEGQVKKAYLKARKKNGRTEYRIHPDGLPEEYKNLYYAELNRRAQEDEAERKLLRKKEREKIRGLLTEDQWRKAINIEYCIENYGHLKGEKLKMALHAHNEKNPEEKPLTYKSFMRHLKDYEEDGIKGIADMRGIHRKGETKVNESDYEYFRDAFCTQNEKSAPQCWRETFGKAKREKRITNIDGQDFEVDPKTGEVLGTFPSEATFKRLVYSRLGEAAITEMRKGKHRFKQTIHFNHVDITREMTEPGEIYVMDHHTLDVLCKPTDKKIVTDLLNKILYHNISGDEKEYTEQKLKRILKSGLSSKKHVRLWLTNCMDYRTNKQLSWFLHEDAPNTDHVMLTFKWAVQMHGYPEVLMMDNGKDFLAYDFAGNPYRRSEVYDEVKIHNLLSYIPTKEHFVTPRESQAKPIERQYRNIIDQFAKQWPTYTGKNPSERPERTSELVSQGKMPTAIEVIEKFDEFVVNILNRKAQNGKALNGKSPDQVWNQLHPGKRSATGKALDLMTMRNSKPRQLHGNGFKMPLMGEHFYWGDWMQGMSSTKEKYYAKWDPYNWNKIFVFRARDNKPMGEAFLNKMTPAYAKTEEQRKKVAEEIQKKEAGNKRRKITTRQIRKIAAGEQFDNMAAFVEHENEVYDAIHETRDDGKKPMKLVHTGLDKLAESMKNSFENKQKTRSETDLSKLLPAGDPGPKKQKRSPLDGTDVSDMFDGPDNETPGD
jgi:hypothetical protein